MKKTLIFSLLMFTQIASADVSCLGKRQAFLSHFGLNVSGYAKYLGEYAYANVHEADDVLDDDQFKKLCPADQLKFKRIIYSTFRMILVDQDGEEIEIEDNEITGTLVSSRTWLVSFPKTIYSSFINFWTKDKSLRIKLINFDGTEAIVSHMTNNNMVNAGYNKEPSILKSFDPIEKINSEFSKKSLISIPLENIRAGYDSFLLDKNDMTSFNGNIFTLGYDGDDLNIGFGLNSSFKDMNGQIHASSSKTVSRETFGGGVYDENFDLVGIHYYNGVYSDTNKKDEYKKVFNVVDQIPQSIVNRIKSWIQTYREIEQFSKDRQKKSGEQKKTQPRIYPKKGTKSKDY